MIAMGRPRRNGTVTHTLLVATSLVIALPVLALSLLPRWGEEKARSEPLTYTVARGRFLHEIPVKGQVESASNVEVRCEVEAQGFWKTNILEVIPEGTHVEPGDFLIRLDSGPLKNLRLAQLIECDRQQAYLIKARSWLDQTKIALEEYRDGLLPRDRQRLDDQLAKAREKLRQAEQTRDLSQEMYRKGYVTKAGLEADVFAAEKAKVDFSRAETKLNVLTNFTSKKRLGDLRADLAVATAYVKWREHVHQLSLEKLDELQEQIEKCVITAPSSGEVVYANLYHHGHSHMIREGEFVWEGRVLFRLPNSEQMQIKATIDEADVARVRTGMPVRFRLKAFPEVELTGEVERINEFPEPVEWFGPKQREYETTIRIDPESLKVVGVSLKPGLSAEAKILVEDRQAELQVPLLAILKHGQKRYCLTCEDGDWRACEVEVGPTNGTFVVVRSGLEPGQEVVLGAAKYGDKVGLPELKPEG